MPFQTGQEEDYEPSHKCMPCGVKLPVLPSADTVTDSENLKAPEAGIWAAEP